MTSHYNVLNPRNITGCSLNRDYACMHKAVALGVQACFFFLSKAYGAGWVLMLWCLDCAEEEGMCKAWRLWMILSRPLYAHLYSITAEGTHLNGMCCTVLWVHVLCNTTKMAPNEVVMGQ